MPAAAKSSVALPASASPSPAATPRAGPTSIPLVLQPIGFAEAERADLLGAGCTWTDREDDAMLFIASADRGAIKVGGRIVRFEADRTSTDIGYGARGRYTGEGIGAVLTPTGPSARSGDETIARPATLSIGADGIDDTPRPGTLSCGA